MKRLYVGNLADSVDEDQLREKFEEFGKISDINLITDRETGRCKGFAFVDMENDDEAEMAMDDLEDYEFEGRPIQVNEARMPDHMRGRGRRPF